MEKIISKSKFYRTHDLAAIVTITLFMPFDSIDRQNPRRIEFLFRRGEELEEILEKYWRGEIRVEPKQFFSQLKIIKSRLYSEE